MDSEFCFTSIAVKDRKRQPACFFSGSDPILVEIRYTVRGSLSGCQIGCRVYNSDGLVVFTTTDADGSGVSALPKEPGYYQATFTIPGGLLAPGTYYLLLAAHLPLRTTYEIIDQAVSFEITLSGSLASLDGRLGVVSPFINWETLKESLV